MEIAKAWGRWPYEFDALPSDEQARIMAHHEVDSDMSAWFRQLAEDEARKREAQAKRRAGMRGRGVRRRR